jgi:hypothetical protein|tara:strand:+ start:44 stop:409 length:366 start_codon:yes stop_codon:yes gene_type:complete
MMKVTKIETFRNKYGVRFSGTLRNEFNFDLGEIVFIQIGGKMIQTKVIGKELPPVDNSEWIYKIELPNSYDSPFKEYNVSVTCEHIFKSEQAAKESAIKHLDRMHELDTKNIEEFFNQESK